ncbi:MAG: DUF1287 domain-containing protein [Acidobacteria bacterium]|nr:DUF1287 domain-containing protein [Acidobacteriota bacterium]
MAAKAAAAPAAKSPERHAAPVALRAIKAGATTDTLVAAALSQIGRTTLYDPSYVRLKYPGGDVPIDRGVCTDVVVRAFRGVGIDLQVAVHEDMARHFAAYPHYGKSRPDANIDHRRVFNLATFFARSGTAAPITHNGADYLPGDVVMWNVDGLAHTGLVASALADGTDHRLVVHNIGDGTQLEDILFEFPITGHFRYPLPRPAQVVS